MTLDLCLKPALHQPFLVILQSFSFGFHHSKTGLPQFWLWQPWQAGQSLLGKVKQHFRLQKLLGSGQKVTHWQLH